MGAKWEKKQPQEQFIILWFPLPEQGRGGEVPICKFGSANLNK